MNAGLSTSTPTRDAYRVGELMAEPRTVALPLVGRISPSRMRMRVDLPDPFDRRTQDRGAAARRPDQPQQDADEGRLARPVRPDEADDAGGGELDGEAVEGRDRPEATGQVGGGDDGHGSLRP
jgi:hypothetical protein